MRAVSTEFVGENKGIVLVVSAEEPASLSITGADVDGLMDDYVLAAGSVIVTPSKNYIAFEDGDIRRAPFLTGLSRLASKLNIPVLTRGPLMATTPRKSMVSASSAC